MAIQSNRSFTDMSAIHIGPSVAQTTTPEKVKDSVDVAKNDEASKVGVENEEKKGFSFFDMLDVINPLQHIPIVSSIYRHFTGDDIRPSARVAGGALFGGPIGAAVSGVDAIIAQESGGEYFGDRVLASIIGDPSQPSVSQVAEPEVMVAMAEPEVKSVASPEMTFASQSKVAQPEINASETMPEATAVAINWDDEFLLDDFKTEAENLDRERKLALARENYLKSISLNPAPGSYVSQLQ